MWTHRTMSSTEQPPDDIAAGANPEAAAADEAAAAPPSTPGHGPQVSRDATISRSLVAPIWKDHNRVRH